MKIFEGIIEEYTCLRIYIIDSWKTLVKKKDILDKKNMKGVKKKSIK